MSRADATSEHDAGLPRPLSVTELTEEGRRVLLLAGELDLASAPILEAAIVRIPLERPHATTLDLRGLTFLDVSGLHAIVYAWELYAKLGYAFTLVPAPAAVQRLFEITGTDALLPFERRAHSPRP